MDGLLGNLQRLFEGMGIAVDSSILNKCVEICSENKVSNAEEFVDAWMAYSVSKLHGATPSVLHLSKFGRDEFRKKMKETCHYPSDNPNRSLVVNETNDMEVEMDSEDVMKLYDNNLHKVKGPRTPENVKRRPRDVSSPQAVFSPASFSPTITSLSSRYKARSDSGEVVFPYKNEGLKSDREVSDDSPVKIEFWKPPLFHSIMNFDLVDALEDSEDSIETIGSALVEKFGLGDPVPVRHKHPKPFITVGKIGSDSDSRLNSKSIILEGSRSRSLGEAIPLDLEEVGKYSLFPGQVVAIEGSNVSGDKLTAKKIFCDATPEQPLPGKTLGAFRMTIAAGPFTLSDSMVYQPLLDLMEVVSSDEPDVLILIGPFVDCTHPIVKDNFLTETHEELFEKIVDLVMKPLENKKTQVVFVSSYKDCNADYMYPTPSISLKEAPNENVILVPDPSLIEIEGVVIGVTSTDCLMHVGKEEISSPGYSSDRLSRIASHILSQRHFYPLQPAAGVPVDPLNMELAKFDIKPHVMILPSDLRYFIKDVSGCVVINPGRLAKGLVGGTFARLNLDSSGLVADVLRI